jgi:hypothetical protein
MKGPVLHKAARGIAGAAIAAATTVAVVSPAGAVPRPDPIGAHQHYLAVPGAPGEVIVGPDSCERGGSRQFDEFHHNVHAGPAPVAGRACP